MCGSLVCHHVYYVFYYCFVCCTYPSYFPFFSFLFFFFWTELSWKLIKNVYLNRGPNKLMLQCPSLLHQMYMLFINWMYFICDNKLCWTWTWTLNLKCYGFYTGTVFARQNQGSNFLISEPPGQNHTPVVVTCFSSFGIFGLVWKASHWDGMYWIISSEWQTDPFNKPFPQKINISCVEIRMFRVIKWFNTIADDDLVRCVARSSASAVL